MTIASSTALEQSYVSQLGSGTYNILSAFILMGIAFLVFYFAWHLLRKAVRNSG